MTEHICDSGWVHIQHPLKPAGVSMQMLPCIICNPSGTKPLPNSDAIFTLEEVDDEDCITISITVIPDQGL